MNRGLRGCLGLLMALAVGPAFAAEKTIQLTSLEWPPYSGAKIEQQGASIAVVRAAAEAMGYTLEVKFFPWNRAVALAKDANSGYVGYFPEYQSDELAKEFVFSNSIGTGPLGLVELKTAPVAWGTLNDLKGKTIGTVDGYVNTTEFDALVAKGELKVDPVVDDATNVKKVAAGRIPVAVIDGNVLEYMLNNDPALAVAKDKVQFNAKPLENKTLHIAFQSSEKGKEAAQIINEGLKKIDVNAIVAKFFAK